VRTRTGHRQAWGSKRAADAHQEAGANDSSDEAVEHGIHPASGLARMRRADRDSSKDDSNFPRDDCNGTSAFMSEPGPAPFAEDYPSRGDRKSGGNPRWLSSCFVATDLGMRATPRVVSVVPDFGAGEEGHRGPMATWNAGHRPASSIDRTATYRVVDTNRKQATNWSNVSRCTLFRFRTDSTRPYFQPPPDPYRDGSTARSSVPGRRIDPILVVGRKIMSWLMQFGEHRRDPETEKLGRSRLLRRS